jgi:hypothetical protein
VEDKDPIKQLQSLLDDRGKVLEKISAIHSVLTSIKAPSLATDETRAPAEAVHGATGEEPYDRLLHMLHDMRSHMEDQVQPLARQAVNVEIARLREGVMREQDILKACLERLDQSVLACVERAQDYQRGHLELANFNQRFVAFGAIPEILPECPLTIDAIINSRLEQLRSAGKI